MPKAIGYPGSSDNEPRTRRFWTKAEDASLRSAIHKVEGSITGQPSHWCLIAEQVPGRTNKDCRKRWFGKMERAVNRGKWSPEEDHLLLKTVQTYGTSWSLVASIVKARSVDQCAKRWTDVVNPEIDHSPWNPEEDQLLLKGAKEHGHTWAEIALVSLPRRSGMAAKNRYHVLRRAEKKMEKKKAGQKSAPALVGPTTSSTEQTDETTLPQSTPSCSAQRNHQPLTTHHVATGRRKKAASSPTFASLPQSSRPSLHAAADHVRYDDRLPQPHYQTSQERLTYPAHTAFIKRTTRPLPDLPYFEAVGETSTVVMGSEERAHHPHPQHLPAGPHEGHDRYGRHGYHAPPAVATPSHCALPTPPVSFPLPYGSSPPQQHAGTSSAYWAAVLPADNRLPPPRAPEPSLSRPSYPSRYQPSSSNQPSSSSIPYQRTSYPGSSYYVSR